MTAILKGVVNYIKNHKKLIGVGLFIVVYIIFWLGYFGEKNVGVGEQLKVDSEKKEEMKKENKEELESVDNKKKFTDADLGNFWIEVDTEKVKIKAPIVNGVTSDKLKQGVGHHKTTSLPGEGGNVVLSGHRWKFGNNPSYTVFEDLNQLKEGDVVTVHYGNKKFIYKIKNHKTVSSKAVEILNQTDNSTLTLYTCIPKYTSLRRLVYTAELVN